MLNRRTFLGAIFGSAVASALPQARSGTHRWGKMDALGYHWYLDQNVPCLKVGDRFTMSSVYRDRAHTFYTIISVHESADELNLELSLNP
jgi:hypothetical protein